MHMYIHVLNRFGSMLNLLCKIFAKHLHHVTVKVLALLKSHTTVKILSSIFFKKMLEKNAAKCAVH